MLMFPNIVAFLFFPNCQKQDFNTLNNFSKQYVEEFTHISAWKDKISLFSGCFFSCVVLVFACIVYRKFMLNTVSWSILYSPRLWWPGHHKIPVHGIPSKCCLYTLSTPASVHPWHPHPGGWWARPVPEHCFPD